MFSSSSWDSVQPECNSTSHLAYLGLPASTCSSVWWLIAGRSVVVWPIPGGGEGRIGKGTFTDDVPGDVEDDGVLGSTDQKMKPNTWCPRLKTGFFHLIISIHSSSSPGLSCTWSSQQQCRLHACVIACMQ